MSQAVCMEQSEPGLECEGKDFTNKEALESFSPGDPEKLLP